VRLTNRTEGLPADTVIANGLPVDPTSEFLPFGPQPEPGGSIAIACDDAFKRSGARATVLLRLSAASRATPTADLQLVYEYGTGPNAWEPLGAVGGDLLGGAGDRRRRVSFVVPTDWAETDLSGETHRWLRIRIGVGSYGPPPTFRTAQNADGSWETRQVGGAQPPVVAQLTVGYAFSTPAVEPDHCRSRNHFTWADHHEAIRWGRQPFLPFRPLPDPGPATYLGFDRPLPVGLVSLFADVDDQAGPEVSPDEALLWEYRSPSGWSDLSVRDGTAGFQRSGAIQFIGPPDLVADAGPEQAGEPARPLYWLRGRVRTTASPAPRPVRGLYLNAVPATARRAVRNEPLGRGDGAAGLALTVQRPPVLPRERVEVQEWAGETQEWASLFADLPPSRLRYDRDPRGAVRAVWVTWEPRPHLYSSGPGERHYTIDRPTGTVRFGDGVQGAVPAPGAAVRISYDHGGGVGGNVPAGSVDQLHSAVPYVEAVTNPLTVDGGAPTETVAQVRVRGPERLRTRCRAVAAADYEALAREASTEVAVAGCLPTTGRLGSARTAGTGQAGRVTVVIAPFSRVPQPQPSRDLIELVRGHLADSAPAAVADGIRVVGPAYTPISVLVNATVADPSLAAETEHALRTALEEFLHPVTGGPEGTGWGFGGPVHVFQIARLVESVPGVDHASALQLSTGGAVEGDQVDVPAGNLPASGRHVIRLALDG
jgi:predicted phage baseplate assembly protein